MHYEDDDASRRAAGATGPRVLVVDGDDEARRAAIDALSPAMRVFGCTSGRGALEVDAEAAPFELAVIDMSLDDMAATHLAERLCAAHRGLRVLFTSTRTTSPVLGARRGFLAKPYSEDELKWAVGRLSRSR